MISNRYFNHSINKFQKSNNIKIDNYCDIDSIYQNPEYQQCSIINQIADYNLFGDKYTHYDIINNYNPNTPSLLPTYLFTYTDLTTNQMIYNKINNLFKSNQKIWILKPRNDYGRHGVTIVKSIKDILNFIKKEGLKGNVVSLWILQKYVENPLLLDGLKFHFRIYTLLNIKSNQEIEIYLYKKGFIYTAGQPYNKYSNDLTSHLSGEDNPNRVIVFSPIHPLFKKVFPSMIELVKENIIPVLPYVTCPNDSGNCFKFLGLDVLIDENYQLYLAEINARLISLKYPPPGFKDGFYRDILNIVILNKKPKNMIKVFNYKKYNKKNVIIEGFTSCTPCLMKYLYIIVFILILTVFLIYIKRMIFNSA